VWVVANGEAPDCVKNHPLLRGIALPRTGTSERGGVLLTKTLLFSGEGSGFSPMAALSGGRMFTAYDKQTGAVLWELTLPANQTGGPITYMTRDKQFIVIPIGSRTQPAELVALALP
jgi:quinoprotein glucose dehydrogenase